MSLGPGERVAQALPPVVHDRIEIDPSPIRNKINEIIGSFKKKFDDLQMQYDEEVERAESGEGVDSGVIKSVKVYVASKRKLSVR